MRPVYHLRSTDKQHPTTPVYNPHTGEIVAHVPHDSFRYIELHDGETEDHGGITICRLNARVAHFQCEPLPPALVRDLPADAPQKKINVFLHDTAVREAAMERWTVAHEGWDAANEGLQGWQSVGIAICNPVEAFNKTQGKFDAYRRSIRCGCIRKERFSVLTRQDRWGDIIAEVAQVLESLKRKDGRALWWHSFLREQIKRWTELREARTEAE